MIKEYEKAVLVWT